LGVKSIAGNVRIVVYAKEAVLFEKNINVDFQYHIQVLQDFIR